MIDHFYAMSLDLNTILKDWPHEPGMIKVRKVPGLDGRDKLQLRIDLGVLQMEMTGRPDGLRPHGCESLLSYHQNRAQLGEASGDNYELTPEECSELQQEGIQYYHRYVSLFQLSDYAGVIRDTQRNLDLFNFVDEHSQREEIVWNFQQSNFPELATKSSEVAFLEEWLQEVSAKRPRSKLEIMEREMETAIAKELYERAAELRDAINLLKAQKPT